MRCAPGTHEAAAALLLASVKDRPATLDLASGSGSFLARLRDHGFADLDAVKKRTGEIKKSLLEKTDILCPSCGKHHLVKKFGRNGAFLACPGYPECKHTQPLDQSELPVPVEEGRAGGVPPDAGTIRDVRQRGHCVGRPANAAEVCICWPQAQANRTTLGGAEAG